MDNNELVKDNNSNVNTYRATTNLNTAIENPQLNINSAMGVNIQDSANNNSNTSELNNYQNDTFSSNNYTDNSVDDSTGVNAINGVNNVNLPTNDSTNVNSNTVPVNGNNSGYVATGDVNGDYEPAMEVKKRKGLKITISKELKMMIFIIFVLVIFVMTMPSIYDFFEGLGLIISG